MGAGGRAHRALARSAPPPLPRALAAGAGPGLVAGGTPPPVELLHGLPAGLTGTEAVEVERARAAGPPSILIAGVTPAARQPQGRAPTVGAGALRHALPRQDTPSYCRLVDVRLTSELTFGPSANTATMTAMDTAVMTRLYSTTPWPCSRGR